MKAANADGRGGADPVDLGGLGDAEQGEGGECGDDAGGRRAPGSAMFPPRGHRVREEGEGREFVEQAGDQHHDGVRAPPVPQ